MSAADRRTPSEPSSADTTAPVASRRSFLRSAGVAATTAATAATAVAQVPARPSGRAASPAATQGAAASVYLLFNPWEAQFIELAVERLIPSDATGPGAIEAGVPFFIDRQLAGAWGAGERLYRSGPWQSGTPQQGYQLPYTPAELFRTALSAVREAEAAATPFVRLHTTERDSFLRNLQRGNHSLAGVPGVVFFESLWGLTLEGYFGDPVYGGNRNMAAWRMIGFPGAYANYYHEVDRYNVRFARAPVSLADNGRGVIHIHPDIPASPGQRSPSDRAVPQGRSHHG